ncbi:MAG: FAD-dependent oxidoreductase, partial [Clostridia bacterium]|nr:FAD-dependent oxidoreductase [Clostridia bacterium]
MDKVKVIGAGLAGCEAALQLSKYGIAVELYEMKPKKFSPAHHSDGFAELVCSNSLKAERVENACGLLKAEMRQFGSVMMQAADVSRVPAGGALAVDR